MTVDLLDIIDRRIDDAVAEAIASRDSALAAYNDACEMLKQLHAVKQLRGAMTVKAEDVTPKLMKEDAA